MRRNATVTGNKSKRTIQRAMKTKARRRTRANARTRTRKEWKPLLTRKLFTITQPRTAEQKDKLETEWNGIEALMNAPSIMSEAVFDKSREQCNIESRKQTALSTVILLHYNKWLQSGNYTNYFRIDSQSVF